MMCQWNFRYDLNQGCIVELKANYYIMAESKSALNLFMKKPFCQELKCTTTAITVFVDWKPLNSYLNPQRLWTSDDQKVLNTDKQSPALSHSQPVHVNRFASSFMNWLVSTALHIGAPETPPIATAKQLNLLTLDLTDQHCHTRPRILRITSGDLRSIIVLHLDVRLVSL